MISQISNYAYPREASYNTNASAPTTGMEAQDPNALAPAGADSFNSSASNLAPTTAPAEEPQKKGPNYLAWGALATLAIPAVILGGKSAGWWLKEAVEESGKAADDLAKSIDGIVGKFKGFSKQELDGLSPEQLKQIHGADDETAAKKLLAELKAAAPSTPPAPKPTVPVNPAVARGLEGIDLEKSSAVDINRALADNAQTVKREAEDAQRALEITFEENKDQIKQQARGFEVSKHSTIGYGKTLHRNSQIETESKTLIDGLARTAKNGDAIDKAKATYQLNNGFYKLVGFNDAHQPIYKFEAKPLYSEAEEQVLGLHYAGRTDVAEEVARANNLEYTADGTTLKGGTKSIELTKNSIDDYVALVNGGKAVALNEHGQVMTKEQVAGYIAECAKEAPNKTPDLEMIGLYFKDGTTEIKPRIIVNTGADQVPKPRFSLLG